MMSAVARSGDWQGVPGHPVALKGGSCCRLQMLDEARQVEAWLKRIEHGEWV